MDYPISLKVLENTLNGFTPDGILPAVVPLNGHADYNVNLRRYIRETAIAYCTEKYGAGTSRNLSPYEITNDIDSMCREGSLTRYFSMDLLSSWRTRYTMLCEREINAELLNESWLTSVDRRIVRYVLDSSR